MHQHTLSQEQVERLLQAALSAPSAENCQPFTFHWDGHELSVFHHKDRAAHHLNCNYITSYLALGCLLEALDIQASHEQISSQCKLHLAQDFTAPVQDGVWVTVSFSPEKREPDPLQRGLALRSTDRRPFLGGSVHDPIFTAMETDTLDSATHTQLRFLRKDATQLIDYMVRCDDFFWESPESAFCALDWIRYSDKEVQDTRDGLPWQNLYFSTLEARMLQWMPRSRRLFRTAGQLGGKLVYRSHLRRQLERACTFGCVATRKYTPAGVVAVGRLAFRSWLRLNLAGYGFHPYSMSSMVPFGAHFQLTPALPSSFQELFRDGQRLLAEQFGLSEGYRAVWLFRTGFSTPLPAQHRTLRRRLHEVATFS